MNDLYMITGTIVSVCSIFATLIFFMDKLYFRKSEGDINKTIIIEIKADIQEIKQMLRDNLK